MSSAGTAQRAPEDHDGIKSGDSPKNAGSARPNLKQFHGDGLDTGVRVLGDGRLDIRINERKSGIASLLAHLKPPEIASDDVEQKEDSPDIDGLARDSQAFPLHLNIVIQVIGSRGDIQPFVALGKELKSKGHRVRLATHLSFRDFVLDGGLEFFDIGGDPAELMAFMVKNPGLLPGVETIRSGAIRKRRREMKQMIDGCWRSCFEMGDGTQLHQIKEDPFSDAVDYRRRPFVADAIIANPPSLAHIHCAQRLGVPLHIMFTMPWSPTQSFPHPLATINHQDCKPTVANFVSYAVVDMMVWEGLGDIVNKFRKTVLSLDGLDSMTAPSLIHRLKTPVAYLWSPAVLPKPSDWGDNIDVCGFSFLPSKADYTPSDELDRFLKAGPMPIYVGFGSIVVDDQVSCVIHHGGAGTTAAGLALGCPTIIVPFFGDQQFWGEIVSRAGAGPLPIPHKQLTVDKLTDAIKQALEPSTRERAKEISRKMEKESGVRDGVRSFHRHLDVKRLQCSICPSRPAVWDLKNTEIGLSAFAAAVLVEMGRVQPDDLVLHRSMEYDTYRDPVGPLSASAQVLFGAISYFMSGLTSVPAEIVQEVVSAGRAVGHPHRNTDPHSRWHIHKHHNEEEMESDESSEERSNAPAGPSEERSSGSAGLESPAHERDSVGGETLEIDRRRSLQLEKQPTMGSEVISSKSHGVFSEAITQGNRLSMKFINLVIWLPTDLTLSLAKGFHNVPKLYHDPMVKSTPQVTGLRSGFKAAGKVRFEFDPVLHFSVQWLTFTGTARRTLLRCHGSRDPASLRVQEERCEGNDQRCGERGWGGSSSSHPQIESQDLDKSANLFPHVGLWGLAGYPLSGLRRKLLDSLGKSQENRIILSRIAQGLEEMRTSSGDERAHVAQKWALVEEQLQQANRSRRSRSSSHRSRHSRSSSDTRDA
ncbi:hypothetical protein N7468_005807 [Penicillium chermesinum]|uniref:Glycosyltransferase family 28 N-terminal domain-containing protein n=1 Tax=Penicillium chermesinum TaxID=63820 RepID=A0A9W9TNB3_9EURO|nr:uncharacterized protein N7468_005807 [Penicillium chermesinum]KAJ5232851.1 hypothetical protein N7468_005807 [Penicillium chermesinum]